jgi:signal transduction histidine kinase
MSTNASTSDQLARLERLVALGRLLNATLELEPLLALIIGNAAQMVGAEAASILLEDRQTGELRFVAATSADADELAAISVPMDNSIAGAIFRSGEPRIIHDVRDGAASHYAGVDHATHFATRSLLGVPLQMRGHTLGVLEAVNKREGRFTESDVNTLQILAGQAAVALHNARLVTDLREANRRLSKIDKLKSNFISVASHELRTPLGLVLGYAHLINQEATGELREQADLLCRGALRLQEITESLTNLNYLESGHRPLEMEPTVLQALIQTVAEEWRPLVAAKQQLLCTALPSTPVRAIVDQEALITALNNLLHNASKFTPPGGTIEITLYEHLGKVALSVSDTGIGIPDEDLSRIFERFYQVEDHMTRRFGGLGLGLSVVRRIVELHSGHVWAESTVGEGSRFIMTLSTRWEEAVQGEGADETFDPVDEHAVIWSYDDDGGMRDSDAGDDTSVADIFTVDPDL